MSGVTIDASVLARAMRHAAAVTGTSNTIPILANVMLRAGGEQLEVVTTDLDCEFRQRVALREAGELATTVDSKRLAALAASVDGGAQVSLALENNRLTVKGGRSRWMLPAVTADDFPQMVVGDLPASVSVPAAALAALIARTAFAVCTAATRYYMSGVLFARCEGKLRAVATDGHRLMAVTTAIDWPDGGADVIVPPKFLRTIEKLAGEAGDGAVTVEWSAKLIRATVGDVVLTGKTIDGSFPDYTRVIPPDVAEPVRFDPAILRGAVRRVALIASEKARAVKMGREADKLVLTVTSPDHGTGREELPASCAEGFETGFNATYLESILEAIGGDTIELHHADAVAPALLRKTVCDGALAVLMPMRV